MIQEEKEECNCKTVGIITCAIFIVIAFCVIVLRLPNQCKIVNIDT